MKGFWRHRVNGWIALLALATQLILSFGHVHDHGHQPGGHQAASAARTCEGKASAPCPAPDDDEQHCSICWTFAIAGSLVLTAPVALEAPSLEAARLQPAMVTRQLSDTGTVQFQARAPPYPSLG
jgi:hypothetical protein